MKSLFAHVAALLAVFNGLSNACAADLPSQKSPPPAAIQRPLFTGLYAGVQAGYLGLTSQTQAYYAPTNFLYASPTAGGGGFAGGARIGYDWRFGNFVAGLLGDITGASASANNTVPTFAVGRVINGYNHVGVQGSIRGRVGYAFDPVLLYITGGVNLASGQNKLTTLYGYNKENFVAAGAMLGVGLEYALNDRWNVNVEARGAGVDFSGKKTPYGVPLVNVRQHSAEGLVTGGVNYRFGY